MEYTLTEVNLESGPYVSHTLSFPIFQSDLKSERPWMSRGK